MTQRKSSFGALSSGAKFGIIGIVAVLIIVIAVIAMYSSSDSTSPSQTTPKPTLANSISTAAKTITTAAKALVTPAPTTKATPRPTLNPKGINYISGSGMTWHYTDDPKDPRCAKDWNYMDSSNKLILGNIPNITKQGDDKNWCAADYNPKGLDYISGSGKWHYTDDPKDPKCAKNWNYRKSNGTLILGNIPNITMEGDNKNWCADAL